MTNDQRPKLIGLKGIAELLDVKHGTAKKWRRHYLLAIRAGRKPGPGALPPPDLPLEETDGKPMWERNTIEKWAKQTRRMDHETGEAKRATSPGRTPMSAKRQEVAGGGETPLAA